MDTNGVTPIDGYLQAAKAQEHKQREQIQSLKEAMESPHTIERVKTAAFGVAVENGERVLIVGTPDGKRRDFTLNEAVVRVLRSALDMPEEELAA